MNNPRPALLVLLLSLLPVLPGARAQGQAPGPAPKPAPLKLEEAYGSSYAVVIGVNAYPNLPRKWWLGHGVDDARAVREVLIRSYGFPAENITLLTGGDATRKQVSGALASLTSLTRVKPNDRILVYFAGRGATVVRPDGGLKGFLVPSDAVVNLADPTEPEPYLRTCLPMSQVWEYLDLSPAKHALVIADAAFSGLLIKQRGFGDDRLSAAQLQALTKERTRQVITAGRRGEEPVDLEAAGHSAFTAALLELLKKGAEPPAETFTSNQLYGKLFPRVQKLTGGRLSPQLSNSADTEGQFLFFPAPERPVPLSPTVEGASMARVFVKSDPPGAKIFVDGREFREGKTPYTVAVNLGGAPVRSVEIAVELNGERRTSKVALVAGRFTQLPLFQFSSGGKLQ